MAKTKQIEQTKQAIANLKAAVQELVDDGAKAQDIAPYRTNLSEQETRLRTLES